MTTATPVTPGEDRIRLLYRMRARRLFWRMMTRQGIDPAGGWWQGAEPMMARAAANCAACPKTDICRAWLDGEGSPGAGVPDFCPNGRAIEAARIMDPKAADLHDGPDRAGGAEPDLAALLADPLVRLVMKADRVNGEVLRHAMTDTPRFAAAFAAPRLRLGLRSR